MPLQAGDRRLDLSGLWRSASGAFEQLTRSHQSATAWSVGHRVERIRAGEPCEIGDYPGGGEHKLRRFMQQIPHTVLPLWVEQVLSPITCGHDHNTKGFRVPVTQVSPGVSTCAVCAGEAINLWASEVIPAWQ
jgi:hypothetical protein